MKRRLAVAVGLLFWATNLSAQPIPDFSSPEQKPPVVVEQDVEEPEPTPEPEPIEEVVEEPVAVSTLEAKTTTTNEKKAPADEEPNTEIGKCRLSKINYLESASRKLQRAMRSKGYRFKSVGFDATFSTGDRHFTTYAPNHAESVVGVLSDKKSDRFAYVVANTNKGRLVVRMEWSGCSPKTTRIVYPKADTPNVELEPFKYWGFRVLWNLPRRLGKKDATEILTSLIQEE